MHRIIIIEDEAMIALDLNNILTSLGYKVVATAMNGDKALDVIANTPADLILLDIHIKGTLSGIDLAHIINEKYSIPFIYITSFTDTHTLDLASKTMPYGYIVKPFTEKDLKSNISMAIARSSAEKNHAESYDFSALESKFKIQLSEREVEIIKLFINGLSYKETAAELEISVNTVKTYQKRIFQKFQVESKVQLVNLIKG